MPQLTTAYNLALQWLEREGYELIDQGVYSKRPDIDAPLEIQVVGPTDPLIHLVAPSTICSRVPPGTPTWVWLSSRDTVICPAKSLLNLTVIPCWVAS